MTDKPKLVLGQGKLAKQAAPAPQPDAPAKPEEHLVTEAVIKPNTPAKAATVKKATAGGAVANPGSAQKASMQGIPPREEVDFIDAKLADEKLRTRDPVAHSPITLKGTTHSNYPFEELEADQEVFLKHDPYGYVVKEPQGLDLHPDPTAISVQDAAGRHIAYIPAARARVMVKGLAAGLQYHATVFELKGGYTGTNGEMLNHGVDIEVKFFDPTPPEVQ